MGRHAKRLRGASDSGGDLLQRTISHLEKLLASVEATLEHSGPTPALARESANLARAVASVSAEMRQVEKHAREVVARMSEAELDGVIKTHLESLPVERRKAFRDWLDDLDRTGSVL